MGGTQENSMCAEEPQYVLDLSEILMVVDRSGLCSKSNGDKLWYLIKYLTLHFVDKPFESLVTRFPLIPTAKKTVYCEIQNISTTVVSLNQVEVTLVGEGQSFAVAPRFASGTPVKIHPKRVTRCLCVAWKMEGQIVFLNIYKAFSPMYFVSFLFYPLYIVSQKKPQLLSQGINTPCK